MAIDVEAIARLCGEVGRRARDPDSKRQRSHREFWELVDCIRYPYGFEYADGDCDLAAPCVFCEAIPTPPNIILPGQFCSTRRCVNRALKEMARALPHRRADLLLAGYEPKGRSRCKVCREPIEWWLTPSGKFIPFDGGPALDLHSGECRRLVRSMVR